MHKYIYACLCIYIYIERERESHVYIHIYDVCTYMYQSEINGRTRTPRNDIKWKTLYKALNLHSWESGQPVSSGSWFCTFIKPEVIGPQTEGKMHLRWEPSSPYSLLTSGPEFGEAEKQDPPGEEASALRCYPPQQTTGRPTRCPEAPTAYTGFQGEHSCFRNSHKVLSCWPQAEISYEENSGKQFCLAKLMY